MTANEPVLLGILAALALALFWVTSFPTLFIQGSLRDVNENEPMVCKPGDIEKGKDQALRLWLQNMENGAVAGPICLRINLGAARVKRIAAYQGPVSTTKVDATASELTLTISEIGMLKTLVFDIFLERVTTVAGELEWPARAFSDVWRRPMRLPDQGAARARQRHFWQTTSPSDGRHDSRPSSSHRGNHVWIVLLMMAISLVIYTLVLMLLGFDAPWAPPSYDYAHIPVVMLLLTLVLFLIVKPSVPPIAQSYQVGNLLWPREDVDDTASTHRGNPSGAGSSDRR